MWVHSSVLLLCVFLGPLPLRARARTRLPLGVSQPRREFPARSPVPTRRRVSLLQDGSWPRRTAEEPSLNWLFPLRARARTCHGWGVPRRLPAANLLALQSVEKSVLHGYMRPSAAAAAVAVASPTWAYWSSSHLRLEPLGAGGLVRRPPFRWFSWLPAATGCRCCSGLNCLTPMQVRGFLPFGTFRAVVFLGAGLCERVGLSSTRSMCATLSRTRGSVSRSGRAPALLPVHHSPPLRVLSAGSWPWYAYAWGCNAVFPGSAFSGRCGVRRVPGLRICMADRE